MAVAKGKQMPKEKPHLQFQKWAQEYGEIYSLMMGTKTFVVLSSDKVVKELLDRRSANYSGRPDLYTGQTLLSGDKRMAMMVRAIITLLIMQINTSRPTGNHGEKQVEVFGMLCSKAKE
jgi:hypothetical protein